jgi:molybdopterin molybdotransferase
MDVSNLLSVSDAINLIDALPVQTRSISLPLENAAGLRLAKELRADGDCPPFDKSLMDGYAVRSADVASAPVVLHVIGESAAGESSVRPVGANQAMAVMTGAPLPPGADAVVPVEQTDSPRTFVGAGAQVRILQSTAAGRCVARRGSDCAGDELVLPAGTKLNAAQIAVAASVGAGVVPVWDRPLCAVLATGNEIVDVDQTPSAAQIRNSNNPMLRALLARLGCPARDLGVVADDRAAISQRIADALQETDVLFVTGGMSMGKYDYVPAILNDLGGELKITKLAIRPGKPFVLAAMPEGRYVVGLPGNPVSAYVCTLRLASRLLTRMAGGKPDDSVRQMPLADPVLANGPREFYQPAEIEDGQVHPLAWKGSADIFTLARAHGLIIRPASAPVLAAGKSVPVILLDSPA